MATPLAVGFTIRLLPPLGIVRVDQMIGASVAVPAMVVLARRYELALRLLVIILPFQLALFAALYAWGVPGPFVANGGLWKEAAAFALIGAGILAWKRRPRQLDVLDRITLALVALGIAYVAVPELFVGESGTRLGVMNRFGAWRNVVLPFALFFACRRIRFSERAVSALARTITTVGVVIAVIGVFEFVASDTFNTFMVNTIGVNQFRIDVLGLNPDIFRPLDDIRSYAFAGSRKVLRIGGPMVSTLGYSFALLLPIAVTLERVMRGDRVLRLTIAAGLMVTALLFTQTRSAILGMVVVMAMIMRRAPGRDDVRRTRFAVLMGSALVVAVPIVLMTGMADRLIEGGGPSDDVHEARLGAAFEQVLDNPLGTGIGTGAAGSGAGTAGNVTAENQFLDIGIQLGILGLLLFVLVLLMLLVLLSRRAQTTTSDTLQMGVLSAQAAVAGLLIPSWFLQPLGGHATGWVLFATLGAFVGASDRSREHASTNASELVAR